MLPSLLPNPEPDSLQLWHIIFFSLEPHESFDEDIIITGDDDSNAAGKGKEEELVIYLIFFYPSFIFLFNNESHSVQTWKTVLSLIILYASIIQRLPISC